MAQESSHFFRPSRFSSVVAFALPALLLLYYALRGGSYDIVPRQEEALAVWWFLALGFAFGLLPRARAPRSVAVPLVAILLLAVWTAISLSWTSSSERTFAELARFLHYAGLLVLIWSLVTVHNWRAVAAGLLTGAVAVCLLAVLSRLDPGAFPTNYIGLRFQVNRLSYPFNYWNAVGAWAVMSMAMALAWSAHARALWLRLACAAALPVCATAGYLTYSRAALIGTVIGFGFVVILSRNRWVALVHALAASAGTALVIATIRHHEQIVQATGNNGAASVALVLVAAMAIAAAVAFLTHLGRGERWRLPRRPARLAVVSAVVLVAIVVPTAAHGTLQARWHEFRHEPNAVNSNDPEARLSHLNGTRYFIWRSAWHAFTAHPLEGVGAGTFEFWWSEHGGAEFLRDAHSIYVEELGEQGLPGGILILVLLGGLLVVGLRARRRVAEHDVGVQAALISAYGAFLFHAGVDWMWESTAVGVLAVASIAVSAAATSGPTVRGFRVPLRVPLVLLALIAAAIQLPGLASTSDVRKSQSRFSRGNMAAALASANDAIQTEPWAASPYVQRALVEESADQLDAARLDLLRAERKEPLNWRQPLLLARVDAERGDAQAALADYKRAKKLRPKSLFVNPTFP